MSIYSIFSIEAFYFTSLILNISELHLVVKSKPFGELDGNQG